MKALLAGFGGIGMNVYYPELIKLGYDVEILDKISENAKYKFVTEIDSAYDLAVVCTPNSTHEYISRYLASKGTRRIFVEKPGVMNSSVWLKLCDDYNNTQFHLVKNNLYRNNYGDVLDMMASDDVIGVDINWLNENRIPNPGSWFTTAAESFGGISRDLMPHLYCFAVKLFGQDKVRRTPFKQFAHQRWDLKGISSTDYGKVNSAGTYDVDDVAYAYKKIGDVSLRLSASWKEGYDKQSIVMYLRNGSTYEWEFGLCPAEAYGVMLQDTTDSLELDVSIHNFLESFHV